MNYVTIFLDLPENIQQVITACIVRPQLSLVIYRPYREFRIRIQNQYGFYELSICEYEEGELYEHRIMKSDLSCSFNWYFYDLGGHILTPLSENSYAFYAKFCRLVNREVDDYVFAEDVNNNSAKMAGLMDQPVSRSVNLNDKYYMCCGFERESFIWNNSGVMMLPYVSKYEVKKVFGELSNNIQESIKDAIIDNNKSLDVWVSPKQPIDNSSRLSDKCEKDLHLSSSLHMYSKLSNESKILILPNISKLVASVQRLSCVNSTDGGVNWDIELGNLFGTCRFNIAKSYDEPQNLDDVSYKWCFVDRYSEYVPIYDQDGKDQIALELDRLCTGTRLLDGLLDGDRILPVYFASGSTFVHSGPLQIETTDIESIKIAFQQFTKIYQDSIAK